MTINTAKRRKVISGIPLPLPPGVTPINVKDLDWRLSVGHSYIGYLYNIDTTEKRRTIAGLSFPLTISVTPNNLKDAQWRRQAGWSYLVIGIGRNQGRLQFTTARRITYTTQRRRSHETK